MTQLGSIRERIERCASLPTLPAVAVRVLELCQQELLDLNKIGAAISNDPALAVKLMRTANSPIFALRREVTTISYAVSILGINAVRTLVLSFSLAKTLQTGKSAGFRDYWRRSLFAALAAREMCQGCYVGLREEAFLAALLQDVGMLAMTQALGPQYTKLVDASKKDHGKLIELEQAAYGCDHSSVGAWLLSRWKVPSMLGRIVDASHAAAQPESVDGDEAVITGFVRLSGHFADQLAGNPQAAMERLFDTWSGLQAAGIEIDVEGVNKRVQQQAPEVAPLFEVKLDPAEVSAALEQAQEVLLALSVRASQELTDIHQTLARLESRTATLLAEAQKDPLTTVANRSYTTAYLDEVFSAAVSSNRLVGVIFADVDHFKKVNDSHGHAAGDAVLRSVAQTILRSVRGGDFVGRWGGEEFVVVMRADTIQDLAAVAERIRANVAETKHVITAGQTLPVTISLGCALLDVAHHQTAGALLEEADVALYDAKRHGRNQFRMKSAA